MSMKDIFVFVAIVFIGLLGWFVVMRAQSARYRRKPVLTGSERDFFFRLRSALPECHVCPQVAVSALIEPAGMGKMRQQAIASIGRMRAGYAIFDEDMHLLAVVELAHRSRPTRAEKAREACLSSAGVRTVRFHAKRLPSEGKIRASVFTRRSAANAQLYVRTDKELDFRKAPWRNTVNAHL
jgi:hypothetical protein